MCTEIAPSGRHCERNEPHTLHTVGLLTEDGQDPEVWL